MQGYQATPDYYRDIIQHGILDKAHKYIKKYMGKNGKWVYVYKNKLSDLNVRAKRWRAGYDKESISEDIKSSSKMYQKPYKNGRAYLAYLSGKATSYSGQKGSKLNSGIAAGRRRTKYWNKTKTNLSSKGYSNSNSPKGSWKIGKSKWNTYDAPDSIEKVFDSSGYYRRKGRNDAQVARGIYAGRKRRAK